jgi:hypothetical protein
MMNRFFVPATLSMVLLCSCNKASGPASGPHATVALRDGTTLTGMVLSSSATNLELAGDDKVTRNIATNQVRSVNYDDATTTPNTATPAEPPHDNHYHPAETAVTTKTHRVPTGAEISVRTEETIDSARAADGQTFAAEVTRDVLDQEGNVVIPRGANAQIVVKSASNGGRIHAASDLLLDLASVSVDGRRYRLNTNDVVERGKDGVGANKRTAKFAGGGAAVGAIIGAIAGGGKGAAIGAGSGAGAGALGEIVTKGSSVKVPVESILTFRLESPLRIVAAE